MKSTSANEMEPSIVDKIEFLLVTHEIERYSMRYAYAEYAMRQIHTVAAIAVNR